MARVDSNPSRYLAVLCLAICGLVRPSSPRPPRPRQPSATMSNTRMHLLKGTLDVLILRTLGWGPAHGYAISRWIRQSSAEQLQVEEGALYPALRRLEENGLLTSSWKRGDNGREARVYELTPDGKRAMKAEVAAWQRYVAAFARVLESRPTETLA